MRSIHVHARNADIDRVLSAARRHDAFSAVAMDIGRSADVEQSDGWSLVVLHIPNQSVGPFIDEVRGELNDARFIIEPIETLPLKTPLLEIESHVQHVSRLSTIELVIASLQSTGSWRGMLVFSMLSGIIGSYALIFDIAYLAVAAMLINPMGSSVLVAVIAITIGDAKMAGWGTVRFLVSLLVQGSTALAVGLLYGISVSTPMMEQVTSLSTWSVVLAFAAGAAGAQAQVKSDRDSLVSGTAAGFLVAAALAPPTAVLGLSVALGRWDYTILMAFLLALQFVALTLGGWTGLAYFGVRPREPAVVRGHAGARTVMLAAAAVLTVALVVWQTRLEPRFIKADLSRAGLEITREAVTNVPDAVLVESAARFTRQKVRGYDAEAMLAEIIVERSGGSRHDDSISAHVRANVRELTGRRMRDVVPFVNVTVLPRPPASDSIRAVLR